MPKPAEKKAAMEAAKAAFKSARDAYEAAVAAAKAQFDAGTLDADGLAMVVEAESVALLAAKDAFLTAVHSNQKPKKKPAKE
jgi:hypothetical protein